MAAIPPITPGDSDNTFSLVASNLNVLGTLNANTVSTGNLIAPGFSTENLSIQSITTGTLLVTDTGNLDNLFANSLSIQTSCNINPGILCSGQSLFVNTTDSEFDFQNTGALILYGGLGVAKRINCDTIQANQILIRPGNQGKTTLSGGQGYVSYPLGIPSNIVLTIQDPNGGTPGAVYINGINYNNGFTISSTSNLDTSVVLYQIYSYDTICFYADSKIELENGTIISLTKLNYGDRVLSHYNKFKKVYSSVVGFTGYFPEKPGNCIKIETDQKTLVLSEDHLIFSPTLNKFICAKDINIDENILRDGFPCKVLNKTSVLRTGFISPLTRTGTIVVEGISCSCHTGSHDKVHRVYYPLYLYLYIFRRKGSPSEKRNEHWYSLGIRRNRIVKKIFGI